MPTIHREALVPYSCATIFVLVNDVLSYPKFLPWCVDSKILEQGNNIMTATLSIGWKGINQSFTTENTWRDAECLKLTLIDGPFKYLYGDWNFKPIGDAGCRVSLDLSFAPKGSLIDFAFSQIFEKIADSLVDSFIKRARDIYG